MINKVGLNKSASVYFVCNLSISNGKMSINAMIHDSSIADCTGTLPNPCDSSIKSQGSNRSQSFILKTVLQACRNARTFCSHERPSWAYCI